MSCEDVQGLIDQIAAGEIAPAPEVAAHLDGCDNCARELAWARRLERLLSLREEPRASSRFAAAVLARVRQDRWRSEQYLDIGFNVAIAFSIVLVVGGLWLLAHATGLGAIGAEQSRLFVVALASLIRQAVPMLPIYSAAAILATTAFGFWWWTERSSGWRRPR